MIRLRVALLCSPAGRPRTSMAFGGLCGKGDRARGPASSSIHGWPGRSTTTRPTTGRTTGSTSPALGQKRDVYVYVPPGYDPAKRYPLMIWLHGLAQDETSFLKIVPAFDQAMASGALPKFVAIAPGRDGERSRLRCGSRRPCT